MDLILYFLFKISTGLYIMHYGPIYVIPFEYYLWPIHNTIWTSSYTSFSTFPLAHILYNMNIFKHFLFNNSLHIIQYGHIHILPFQYFQYIHYAIWTYSCKSLSVFINSHLNNSTDLIFYNMGLPIHILILASLWALYKS